jgi:hypothetical protein
LEQGWSGRGLRDQALTRTTISESGFYEYNLKSQSDSKTLRVSPTKQLFSFQDFARNPLQAKIKKPIFL